MTTAERLHRCLQHFDNVTVRYCPNGHFFTVGALQPTWAIVTVLTAYGWRAHSVGTFAHVEAT